VIFVDIHATLDSWYTKGQVTHPPKDEGPVFQWSLQEIRARTHLGSLDVTQVLDQFADYADDHGLLSLPHFIECFFELVARDNGTNPIMDAREKAMLVEMCQRLFTAFDQDRSGKVPNTCIGGFSRT
jgi:hypothetical protein